MVRDYLLKHPGGAAARSYDGARQEGRSRRGQASAQKMISSTGEGNLSLERTIIVAGNPDGKISVVDSSTIIAVTASHSLPDVLEARRSDKDVRLVIKEFPILGPGSVFAAKAAIAARHQNKYWNFHLALIKLDGHSDEQGLRGRRASRPRPRQAQKRHGKHGVAKCSAAITPWRKPWRSTARRPFIIDQTPLSREMPTLTG